MALSTASKIQFEYMLGGGSPPMLELYEATGSTFLPGALLQLASGAVTICTTGAAASAIIGMATARGSAEGSSYTAAQRVVLATPMTVFSGIVDHATTASAVCHSSNIGQNYPLAYSCGTGAVGVWYVDLDGTTTSAGATIIGSKDTTGTAYGRVYFIIHPSATAGSLWGWSTLYNSIST
jgi:hypothetical protein